MANKFNDIYQPISEESLTRIPAAMKAAARWVLWGGKKVPVNGHARNTHGCYIGADVTDPSTWMDFRSAVKLIGQHCYVNGEHFHAAGVGFVVGDGWFCIDADGGPAHGRDPVPEAVISDLCNRSGSYAEMSISKNGCHVFGQCGFVTQENREHYSESRTSFEIEFFTRRKFLIVTGDRVPASAEDAVECNDEAYDLYDEYVLSGCIKREEEEQKRREALRSSITIDPNDADQFFLLNYPEILKHADVDHFKRGGKGGQLAQGEYSWIGAIKAMDERGVPREAIYEWCRSGKSFAGEKDIDKVLDEKKSSGKKSSTASIIKDAMYNGWKPDPDKLTGEYKEAHEAAVARRSNEDRIDQGYASRIIKETIDPETGEIIQTALVPDPDQPVPGATVYTVQSGKAQEAQDKKQIVIAGYDDVEIRETDYLYFPWFPRGKLATVQGDSGSSKSTFLYGIGALVSIGADLLKVPCEDPGNVMFITNEDDPGDILTGFLDAGGDIKRLRRIKDREQIAMLNLSDDGCRLLDEIIKADSIKLLVLDPIQAFLCGDMNKANETRPQLARLANIAAENNICILFVQHMGKDTSKTALYRGIGSVDIQAATRSVIQIVTDPEDDLFKIAFTVKNNTAALQDVRKAIRYQVKDHPGSFDSDTKRHHHFHGHAEFVELLPEYNDKIFRKAQQKADEEERASIEYQDDPLVLTVCELAKYNPEGLFIGSDDLVRRITEHCGRCPYQAGSKSKTVGLNSRIADMRTAIMERDSIQVDIETNSIRPHGYNWKGETVIPDSSRTKGVRITPIRNGTNGSQQIGF